MTWRPCDRKDCRFFTGAKCELAISERRVVLRMQFDNHGHVGYDMCGGTRYVVTPCLFCKWYDPTKFDLFLKRKEVK